jgi:hypothetical protein
MDHPVPSRARPWVLLLPLTWPGVVYGLWQERRRLWRVLPRPALRQWRRCVGVVSLLACLGMASYGAYEYATPRQAVLIPAPPLTVPQSAIIMTLIRWTECTRGLSTDRKVVDDCWAMVKDFTAPSVWAQLEPVYAQQLQRFQQHQRVEISRPAVTRLTESSIYQVGWDETTFESSGVQVAQESGRWHALLSIADVHGKAARERLDLHLAQRNYRNLLGIVVTDMQWKQRPPLTPAVAQDQAGNGDRTGHQIIQRELTHRVQSQPTVVRK